MSKSKRTKSARKPKPAAPKTVVLDVAKAREDLAHAVEQHKMAGDIMAEAMKREAGMREAVTAAQKTFDDAVEQVRQQSAPFDTAWWNSGRRG